LLALLPASTTLAADTPPSLPDFFWGNQGSCSAVTTPSGKISLFHPGAPGVGFNWCVLVKPLPTAPYSIIVGLEGVIADKAASLGLILYDATTAKFVVYSSPGSSDAGYNALAAWKMTNYTTYSGQPPYYDLRNGLLTGGLLPRYFRLKDDGSYRTFAVSHDKEVWVTIMLVSNTDYLMPNWHGYALRGSGNSRASQMSIFHEAVTNP
jgi:hypothetical protein